MGPQPLALSHPPATARKASRKKRCLMDDNDRREVFDRVVVMLRQHGLGWIVDHVTEQIHSGKTELVEVETIKRTEETDLLIYDPGRPRPAVRRGPKARFSTTVEYDNKEKL